MRRIYDRRNEMRLEQIAAAFNTRPPLLYGYFAYSWLNNANLLPDNVIIELNNATREVSAADLYQRQPNGQLSRVSDDEPFDAEELLSRSSAPYGWRPLRINEGADEQIRYYLQLRNSL
jgi:hypothetical protein